MQEHTLTPYLAKIVINSLASTMASRSLGLIGWTKERKLGKGKKIYML